MASPVFEKVTLEKLWLHAIPRDLNDRSQWVSDSESPFCILCGDKFTAVRRKHHCRRCGLLVCQRCSDHEVVLRGTASPCRVCDLCCVLLERDSVDMVPHYGMLKRLVTSSHRQLQEMCLVAYRNSLTSDTARAAFLAGGHAVTVAMLLTDTHLRAMHTHVLASLANLCNTTAPLPYGGVVASVSLRPLLDLLTAGSEDDAYSDEQVQLAALVLCAISGEAEVLEALRDESGAALLMRLLRQADPIVRECAACVAANMSLAEPEFVRLLASRGTVPVLCAALLCDGDGVRYHCLRALCETLRHDGQGAQARQLLYAGGIASVIREASARAVTTAAVATAVQALELAVTDPICAAAVADGGACALLPEWLSRHDGAVQRAAASILWHLVSTGRHDAAIPSAALSAACALLHDGVRADVRLLAVRSLSIAACSPSLHHALCDTKAECADALLAAVERGAGDYRVAAAASLVNLSASEDGAAVLVAANGYARIRRLQQDSWSGDLQAVAHDLETCALRLSSTARSH